MADNTAASMPLINQASQEAMPAQEDRRDKSPAGHSDASADHHHETRDADTKRIAWIGAGMAAMGIVMFLLLWLLLGLFKRTPDKPDTPTSPLALNPPTPLAPRIQDVTPQSYQDFLHSEQSTLNGSGPVPAGENAWQREASTMAGSRGTPQPMPDNRLQTNDPSPNLYNPGPGVVGTDGAQQPEGTARISIEQAKSAVLQSGLAARPQTRASLFPQDAPNAGLGKPESLPLAIQPTGAYRADVGPMGKNP